MAVVGVVTIEGKEYRLYYGMILAERFSELVVEQDGDKLKVKKPSTPEVLRCIILSGHENWCELNDEPFTLKKVTVATHIEDAYSGKVENALSEFDKITKEFMASRYVDDLVKAGNESKKKASTGKK